MNGAGISEDTKIYINGNYHSFADLLYRQKDLDLDSTYKVWAISETMALYTNGSVQQTIASDTIKLCRIVKIFREKYSGTMKKITFQNGNQITISPNAKLYNWRATYTAAQLNTTFKIPHKLKTPQITLQELSQFRKLDELIIMFAEQTHLSHEGLIFCAANNISEEKLVPQFLTNIFGYSIDIGFPFFINLLDRQYQLAFLRRYMDMNADISENKPFIKVMTNTPESVIHFQAILLKFGIYLLLDPNEPYGIIEDCVSLKAFYNLIGFSDTAKNRALIKCLDNDYLPVQYYDSSSIINIEDIEYNGFIYNFDIDGCENFLANNVFIQKNVSSNETNNI